MIRLKKASRVYEIEDNKVLALNNICLSINEGEFVCIMGSSGSGKSTLLNVLGCLDRLTEGEYLLEDTDINTLKRNSLAEVRNKKFGFVFQSYNLLNQTTALRNVALPLMYSNVRPQERVEKALQGLKDVGLEDRVHHKPTQLSGGQKQRVAIARSLVNNPQILLADEPTGNLDTVSTKEIMKIFKKINEQGKTIILVTHEEELGEYGNRLIQFKDGRIISDEVKK